MRLWLHALRVCVMPSPACARPRLATRAHLRVCDLHLSTNRHYCSIAQLLIALPLDAASASASPLPPLRPPLLLCLVSYSESATFASECSFARALLFPICYLLAALASSPSCASLCSSLAASPHSSLRLCLLVFCVVCRV